MANYFVDSANGNDTDTGLSMDAGGGGGATGAWATFEHALTAGGLAAGDYVWVRRTHSEVASSYWACENDGDIDTPISSIGWPRAADATADGASWTNGNTTVDLVTTLSISREKHLGRYVTGPDGESYMITLVTDSNTFTIDREYAGVTVTTTDGAFTVQADEHWVDDMGTEYGFDDSGWTIKEITWDADADDLPDIDFSGGAYYIYNTGDYFYNYHNFDITTGVVNYGAFRIAGSRQIVFQGCLFDVSVGNAGIAMSTTTVLLDRCVMVGSSNAGHSSNRLFMQSGCYCKISNCAIYNAGDVAILAYYGVTELDNVNLGVEGENHDRDIHALDGHIVFGKNVKLGGLGNSEMYFDRCSVYPSSFENYGKVLGAHKKFYPQGTATKLDVVAGSGDPYKRTGGADSVIEVLFDDSLNANSSDNYSVIFEHEFEATTDLKNYRYYVQAEGVVAAAQLWIECEYVSTYGDTSEYAMTKVSSDEAFTARADEEDWAEYMEVIGITPAVASKVRVRCYCTYYNATNKIYIDPLVVIS